MIGTAMRRREEGPERGEVPPKCDLGNVDLCLEGADLCYESFGRMNLKDLEFYVEGDGAAFETKPDHSTDVGRPLPAHP